MVDEKDLFINLYAANEATVQIKQIKTAVSQKTAYPWDGDITIKIDPESAVDANIKLRIPDWCKSYTVKLNGVKLDNQKLDAGYLVLNKKWVKGDVISLLLNMPVELVAADPRVKADVGKRAIQRGPIVYSLEKADNTNIDLEALTLNSRNKFTLVDGTGILDGIKLIQTKSGADKLTFVPYYAWDNREPGKMLVWVNYKK